MNIVVVYSYAYLVAKMFPKIDLPKIFQRIFYFASASVLLLMLLSASTSLYNDFLDPSSVDAFDPAEWYGLINYPAYLLLAASLIVFGKEEYSEGGITASLISIAGCYVSILILGTSYIALF